MKIELLRFNLPTGLIAQKSLRNPKKTKLLFLFRKENKILHDYFFNFSDYLKRGDLLVLNDSAVLPTRMWGLLEDGGQAEVVLVSKINAGLWEAIVRPAEGFSKNSRIFFNHNRLVANLIKKTEYGGWLLRFKDGQGDLDAVLTKIAEVNTPFYINRRVRLKEYQNVFAKNPGSTQCSTAGLHFSKMMLERIKNKGVDIGFITLHIGGSVLPTTVADYNRFTLYREYFEVDKEIIKKIALVKKSGGRIIAVGTTVVRALETAANSAGAIKVKKGWTSLTIKPGYSFKVVDAFLTNFHLPASSHLLLTTAFAGREQVLNAYSKAIKMKYKFLDFGDAMFII